MTLCNIPENLNIQQQPSEDPKSQTHPVAKPEHTNSLTFYDTRLQVEI